MLQANLTEKENGRLHVHHRKCWHFFDSTYGETKEGQIARIFRGHNQRLLRNRNFFSNLRREDQEKNYDFAFHHGTHFLFHREFANDILISGSELRCIGNADTA